MIDPTHNPGCDDAGGAAAADGGATDETYELVCAECASQAARARFWFGFALGVLFVGVELIARRLQERK